MKTKIYTKGGDLGQTSLFGGPRVSKSHAALEAYGTIDELNALLGLSLATSTNETLLCETSLRETLLKIQNDLFSIGSHLACADEKWRSQLPALNDNCITNLENEIDSMTVTLPELREFILPGGDEVAAFLHVARTVCRRAERATVLFYEQAVPHTPVSDEHSTKYIVKYLNRLSDFLFVAARFVNFKTNITEPKWKKP